MQYWYCCFEDERLLNDGFPLWAPAQNYTTLRSKIDRATKVRARIIRD